MNEWSQRWLDFQKSAGDCLQYLRPEDLMHVSHISLKHRVMYMETPKVGCSTIKSILIRAEYEDKIPVPEEESLHFREFSPLLNAQQVGHFGDFLNREDIFKFCFVRNPYSRLLSCYLDKIIKRKGQEYWLMYQTGHGQFSDHVLSFSEFIDAVCEQTVQQMDWHWRSQYYGTFQNGITFDFIGRFENFQDDLKNAIQQTPIDFGYYYQSYLKHATRADNLLDKYYTPELKAKVYDKFKIDFEYFGYDK